jgi:hypothetical protein
VGRRSLVASLDGRRTPAYGHALPPGHAATDAHLRCDRRHPGCGCGAATSTAGTERRWHLRPLSSGGAGTLQAIVSGSRRDVPAVAVEEPTFSIRALVQVTLPWLFRRERRIGAEVDALGARWAPGGHQAPRERPAHRYKKRAELRTRMRPQRRDCPVRQGSGCERVGTAAQARRGGMGAL